MGGLLDRIEQKRAILVAAKEGAERARKDVRKVRYVRCRTLLVWARGRPERRRCRPGGGAFLEAVERAHKPV